MKNDILMMLQNVINNLSEDNYELEYLVQIFKSHIPAVAREYKFIHMKIKINEAPGGIRALDMIREITIFDDRGEDVTEDYTVHYSIGNGGHVYVVFSIKENDIWDDERKEAADFIAKCIYLLFGRSRVMKTLITLAYTDRLTGIPNELELNRCMAGVIQRGEMQKYCNNFINIKNMKLINNRLGDRNGDKVIVEYAHKISEFVGNTGCIARLGGDNFVVFIEKKKEAELLELLQLIRVEVKMPDGKEVPINVESRVGYFNLNEDSQITDAMRNSDIAYRVSKNENFSDQIEFEEHMKYDMMRLKELEESVPSALKNGEFVAYYQPKADISDKDNFVLCGAEALVRWKRDGKLIPPGEFIPLIEKTGLITKLDFCVFEQVCKNIKEWEAEGKKIVRVSTNFSRRHLRNANFADKIEAMVKKYDVNPAYLEIEITESYNVDDMEALKKFENRIHKMGIDLSVDDFGSGFSSLKLIKNIVSDTIKLDKSIIDGVASGSKEDDIIISHVINMIKSLGKEVIAEGVEEEYQADFLRENGCNKIQGYLYGKPMEKAEFEKML